MAYGRQCKLFYPCQVCGLRPYTAFKYRRSNGSPVILRCEDHVADHFKASRLRQGLDVNIKLKQLGYSWKEITAFNKKYKTRDDRHQAYQRIYLNCGATNGDDGDSDLHEFTQEYGDGYHISRG